MSRAEIEQALAELTQDYEQRVKAAREGEYQAREAAFIQDFSRKETWPVVAGILIRPLTLRDFQILYISGNPMFGENTAAMDEFAACGHFLWAMYADFRRHWYPQRMFLNKLAKQDKAWVVAEVTEHLSGLYIDKIVSRSQASVQETKAWCYPAQVVHQMASIYGWTIPQIMDCPFTQIRQLINLQYSDNCISNGKTPIFRNRSADVINEYMAKRNELEGRLNQATA